MLTCGWSEKKRRDQLLQSKSIVLSTIDTDQSMIGNINKGKYRRKKENCRFFFYSFFFFCRVQPGHSLGILQSFRRDSFRAIATYAILHLWQRNVSSAVGGSTRKRARFTHVTATLRRPSLASISLGRPFAWLRGVRAPSLRCLFVLRYGEPEETRGVTNAVHYSETASQRVPTQFPDFRSRSVASFRLH